MDRAGRVRVTRRAALRHAATLVGAGAASRLAPGSAARVLAQAPAPQRPPRPKGATLVLLGTQGGPSVSLARAEASSLVVVDGEPYLVDCGYGALRALVQAGFRVNEVNTAFITHLHDDHTNDLAALLSLQWTGGRQRPTTVYGPYGTSGLVSGAMAFFKANTDIRTVDEGRAIRPEAIFAGRDVDAGASIVEVFRDERVRVRAAENTHFPERSKARMPYRSLAYRFDTADRSFVFSGDTAYSPGLVGLAAGAEILVCEAMDVATHQRNVERARQLGDVESIARHVAETHVTTEDVGRMAAEAKVKTVVLSHLLPGSGANELPDTAYISAVRKFFDGEVIVGRDQMRL